MNFKEYIENIIKDKDFKTIDILFNFLLSVLDLNGSRYFNLDNQRRFQSIFDNLIERTLEIKYGESKGNREKVKNFRAFKDFFLKNIDKVGYPREEENFREIWNFFITNTNVMLINYLKVRLNEINEIDKDILSYLIRKIENVFKNNSIPNIINNEYRIVKIDMLDWVREFNYIFNYDLGEFCEIENKYHYGYWLGKPIMNNKSQLLNFNEFHDRLLILGLGYYVPWLETKGRIEMQYKISLFLYECIEENLEPKPVNFEKLNNPDFSNFKITRKTRSEVKEKEIESFLKNYPEALEEGLQLIGTQFSTLDGFIDLLCKDKNGNYVVVELKKGLGTDKVVGQIQRYLVWIEKNLAKGDPIRGIIVVSEKDGKLENAVKGSKYNIEVKCFGHQFPIDENIICAKCGNVNRISANFCDKCGKNLN